MTALPCTPLHEQSLWSLRIIPSGGCPGGRGATFLRLDSCGQSASKGFKAQLWPSAVCVGCSRSLMTYPPPTSICSALSGLHGGSEQRVFYSWLSVLLHQVNEVFNPFLYNFAKFAWVILQECLVPCFQENLQVLARGWAAVQPNHSLCVTVGST